MKNRFCFLTMVLAAGAVSAAAVPSALFTDHAVLLRSAETPIFGEAAPGERVAVSLGNVCADATAGADGRWLVRLDLRNVGEGPFDLSVNGRISKDVLVGEVWLCSGQSNMSFTERSADDFETERTLTNGLLRCFAVGGGVSIRPVTRARGHWVLANPETIPSMSAVGYHFAKNLQTALKRPVGFVVAAVGAAALETWCDPETMRLDPRGKAALDREVAFMDGYRAYEEACDAARRSWEKSCGRLDRPHAGIPTAGWQRVAAEKAESFTHPAGAIWVRRTVAAAPGKKLLFRRQRFIEQQWRFDMSGHEVYWNGRRLARRFADDPIDKNSEYFDIAAETVAATNELAVRVFNAESIPNVFYGFALDGRRISYDGWSCAVEYALPPLTDAEWRTKPATQRFCLPQHYPSALFNGRIAGLVPMGLSGVIWYQGETNDARANDYGDLFRTFILSWRKLFQKENLPFAWCQLANYLDKSGEQAPDDLAWPRLRLAQDSALSLPMTGEAVLIDAGEARDIHPRDKRTPGRRLANWALNRVYGRRDIPCLSPRVDGVESRGAALFVRFRDVGRGLCVRDLGTNYVVCSRLGTTRPLRRNSPQAQVEGFALAGADGVWHWADQATIQGDGVLVSSRAVPKPVRVRYAWANNPDVNLYNSDGLPAVPFGALSSERTVLERPVQQANPRNLLPDSGFEAAKSAGWNFPRHWKTADGVGRSGARALVYENEDEPDYYGFPAYRLKAKPGVAYRIAGWVRTENFRTSAGSDVAGRGATICLEWYGEKGKWLGGDYPNGAGTKNRDWMKVEFVTQRMPPEVRTMNVSPLVCKGAMGRAYWDDLEVSEVHAPPVTILATDCYRDTACEADRSVRLMAGLCRAEFPNGLGEAVAAFRLADGSSVAAAIDGEWATAEIPVARLPMGAHEVSFAIRAPGIEPVRKSFTVTRIAEWPRETVRFDRRRRVLVDGKPFFVLGMYFSNVTEGDLAKFSKGPFNCIMPYDSPSREMMDACQKYGIKVIYSVKDCWYGHRKSLRSEADETAWINARASFVTNHPATLAWYVNDEFSLKWEPRLSRRRAFMHALDPNHPCWAVIYQYGSIRDYMPTFDVIGTDPYPPPGQDLERPIVWMRETERQTHGSRPVWQVSLASDGGAYESDRRKQLATPVHTKDEFRNMVWQGLAGGADGVFTYSWFDIRRMGFKRSADEAFAEISDIGFEVKRFADVFLTDEDPVAWSVPADTDRTLAFRTWKHRGATYLLALNAGKGTATVTVRLAGRFAAARTLVGEDVFWKQDAPDAVTFTLPHAAVSFLRLEPSKGL